MAQEVVIVGADGTEHVFPAGFDPKKAAAIVSKAAPAPATPASAPAEPSSPLARAGSAFLETVNPVNAAKSLYQQVRHPIDSANARLQYEEAHPFEAAMGRSPLGQYGGTRAGSRIGQGDVAGGLGEGAGDVFNAATPVILPKVPGLARAGASGALKAGAAVGDFVEAHPAIGAVAGGAVGYAKGGLTGAVEGALSGGAAVRGMKLLKTLQKVQAATGKVPPLEDIVTEVRKAPPEPFEPVLTPGEPPAPGAFTPKQLNEARLAEIRAAYRAKQAPPVSSAQPAVAAVPPEAPAPNDALAARMGTIRNTPSAGGATHYPGDPSLGPAGPNMHDVAARTVDAYQMPSRATEARAQWNPRPASPEEAAAAATPPASPMVTLYRGVHGGNTLGGEFPEKSALWSDSEKAAREYAAQKGAGGVVHAVDVPASAIGRTGQPIRRGMRLEDIGGDGEHTIHYVPPEIATKARVLSAPPEPIPLSKAVTAVRQAATAVKQKLTATEFTEATRLAKAGHPADSVLEAIQVQRALKQQPAFAGLPTDAEMRADLGRRARAGGKGLMAVYGDEPAVAGNPYR